MSHRTRSAKSGDFEELKSKQNIKLVQSGEIVSTNKVYGSKIMSSGSANVSKRKEEINVSPMESAMPINFGVKANSSVNVKAGPRRTLQNKIFLETDDITPSSVITVSTHETQFTGQHQKLCNLKAEPKDNKLTTQLHSTTTDNINVGIDLTHTSSTTALSEVGPLEEEESDVEEIDNSAEVHVNEAYKSFLSDFEAAIYGFTTEDAAAALEEMERNCKVCSASRRRLLNNEGYVSADSVETKVAKLVALIGDLSGPLREDIQAIADQKGEVEALEAAIFKARTDWIKSDKAKAKEEAKKQAKTKGKGTVEVATIRSTKPPTLDTLNPALATRLSALLDAIRGHTLASTALHNRFPDNLKHKSSIAALRKPPPTTVDGALDVSKQAALALEHIDRAVAKYKFDLVRAKEESDKTSNPREYDKVRAVQTTGSSSFEAVVKCEHERV